MLCEAIGELDEDDADVLRHRDDHLPVVLGLRLLAALEADPRQLRDAFDELGHVRAELRAEVTRPIGLGVLDDVVEEAAATVCSSRRSSANPCDAQRVMDELPPRTAGLTCVRALRELEGRQSGSCRRPGCGRSTSAIKPRPGLRDAVCVEDTHVISVLSAVSGSCAAGRSTRRGREVRHPMNGLRRWWRHRNARRLALAMRDALVPARPGLG
jgi:hypothetical protein